MTEDSSQSEPKLSWRFPRTFWIANAAELFERAAYYGMAIALVLYLTDATLPRRMVHPPWVIPPSRLLF